MKACIYWAYDRFNVTADPEDNLPHEIDVRLGQELMAAFDAGAKVYYVRSRTTMIMSFGTPGFIVGDTDEDIAAMPLRIDTVQETDVKKLRRPTAEDIHLVFPPIAQPKVEA